MAGKVATRAMREADLAEVDAIFRLAFGTFIGLPDPATFAGDRDYAFTRFRANPEAALVAEVDGRLAGSNFVTHWGSFGFFGPLTVRPEFWDKGVAQALLIPTMQLFARWGVREAALFTFVQSPKHLGLYQKFGFWPGFLIGLMGKNAVAREVEFVKFSQLDAEGQRAALQACRELSDAVFEGLDLSLEIQSVRDQKLGEIVLVQGPDSLDAFAVCHCGPGTEAGGGNCYIKFAAARPGAGAEGRFERLLDACESLAAARGLTRIEAGVNLERIRAYRQLLGRGFRVDRQALAMSRDGLRAYNGPDTFVLDDWR